MKLHIASATSAHQELQVCHPLFQHKHDDMALRVMGSAGVADGNIGSAQPLRCGTKRGTCLTHELHGAMAFEPVAAGPL
jgi:hypothetical protein